ncbi:MAG: 23S rRNA (adenine(2503)-C(2))-methyltransferase RlmN [bacterium]|nr:23S rRNA (adenine(2503)-C(2))-methyltransferase RlmN [bacterium]
MTQNQQDLLGLPRRRLAEVLAPFIDRPYRTDQIYRALYERGAGEIGSITELGKELRAELAERFTIGLPEVATRHLSADGTEKFLFRLADGATIEAVDIPDGRRRTLCISSQAGCALTCRFCVTGYWGGGRDLTAGEIVAQVLAVGKQRRESGGGLNLVFMGMGEPLLNLGALGDALEILTEQISWRRITVSTAGVIPGIEELAGWRKRPRLAISLHAPDDDRRSRIMPINRRYPLADLLAALRRYPLDRRERLTFEYLLIRDFNDAPADADALVRLLSGLQAKVNLIPLNPDPVLDESMKRPRRTVVTAFRDRLTSKGMTATVRKQRGDDVSAACGQLRAPGREPRGFRRSNLSL